MFANWLSPKKQPSAISHSKESLADRFSIALDILGVSSTYEDMLLNLGQEKECFSLKNTRALGIYCAFSLPNTEDFFAKNQVVIISDKILGYGLVKQQENWSSKVLVEFSDGVVKSLLVKKLINKKAYLLRKKHSNNNADLEDSNIFALLKGGLGNIILASFFMHFLALVVPFYTSIYFNTIVPNEAWATMIALTLGALLAVLFASLLKETRTVIGQWYSQKIEDIANTRALSYMADNHKYLSSMDELARLWIDLPSTIQKTMTRSSAAFVLPLIDLYASILYLVVIYIIADYLVLVPLLLGLVIMFLAQKLAREIIKAEDALLEVSQNKNGAVSEYVKGINQVQLQPKPPLFLNKLKQSLFDYSEKSNVTATLSARFQTIVQGMTQVQTLLLLFVGLVGMVSGDLTVGGVFATLLLVGRLTGNVAGVFTLILQKDKHKKAQAVMAEIDKQVQQVRQDKHKKVVLRDFSGLLKIEDLSHQYQEVVALKHINLIAKPGELMVISGDTGSGKTTLLNLIAGVLYSNTGTIYYDDLKQNQLSSDNRAAHISLALQYPTIFSGSLLGNFHWEDSQNALEKELKSLGIVDFALNSSQGLETLLATEGMNLSGGQRQAISLARAIIRSDKPKMLLLDEPLSGLDSKQQLQLITYLTQQCRDKTIIIASNDRTILTLAKRIVQLQNGVIVSDIRKADNE